ncbi:ATP-binding cassette domain-containing protein [Marinospirillum sp.]|uniref:ATP-binding cassette domain-containing protein n=1 Tax=Marinospirillum sp. TaxID=2183934 RepID=UPI003A8C0073
MISLNQLTLRRGALCLLDQASVSLHTGWKVGLTGANGAGKSSLFQLLLGQLTPDAGELQMSGYQAMAHMAQEVDARDRSALDYVLDGHQPLRQVEAGLIEAEAQGDNLRLAELHGEYDLLQGYSKVAEAEQLLAGLGFAQESFHRPVSDFSGGWRIRLNLAQTLFMPSDLLLLDEPTNHLDLDATLWLEGFLKAYSGTLILISHDRDFLDSVITHLLHVEHKKLNLYKGGYSDFERQRAERLAQQQAQFVKQQRDIAHMEDFIRRFKAKASKAKQAQSRVKALERMEKLLPAHLDSPFEFSFPVAEQMSDPLVVLREAQLGYAQQPILTNVGFTLHPDQRIGLLGPNGAGKSTLIKSLVGDLPLVHGTRVVGEHLKIGYFAQHQLEALDITATPLLHLQRLAPQERELTLRKFLGGFGFQGDEALASIQRFSGGEKARLALAIIAWQRPNLLLLDEPTNHLDLDMRHALTLALQAFEGAVLVVSHDRHLLKHCVDDYWLVAEGRVAPFDGLLEDYAQWLKQYQLAQKKGKTTSAEPSPSEPSATTQIVDSAPSTTGNKKLDRQEAAKKRAQLQPLKKKINQLEDRMEQQRQQLAQIEEQLGDAELYQNPQKRDALQTLLKQQSQHKQTLEEQEMQWLELSEELEALTLALGL